VGAGEAASGQVQRHGPRLERDANAAQQAGAAGG